MRGAAVSRERRGEFDEAGCLAHEQTLTPANQQITRKSSGAFRSTSR